MSDMKLSALSERVLGELSKCDESTGGVGEASLFAGPDFDALAVINSLLPSASSLSSDTLATHLSSLSKQAKSTDANMRSALRTAACERHQAEHALDDAQNAVQDLFLKVDAIKSKSAASQKLVHDISSDIRVLDTAKRHLTSTITALKRMHMLGNAVDQLRSAVQNRDFSRAANLIEAVQSLQLHFDSMADIPRVNQIRKKTSECRDSLRAAVFEAFGAAHTTGSSVGDDDEVVALLAQALLADACDVAQVLGKECRDELIASVVRRQLEPYRAVFAPSDAVGGMQTDDADLDRCERRYAWLRRQLKTFAQRFEAVFPLQWNVPGTICAEFCKLTHSHLSTILQRSQNDATLDPSVLVRVLTQTIAFEEELERFYGRASEDVQRYYDDDPDKFEEAVDPGTAEAVRRKYQERRKEEEWKQREVEARQRVDHQRHRSQSRPTSFKDDEFTHAFKGSISSSFGPFMGGYVILERNNIKELLHEIESNEDWNCTHDDESTRFKGSDEMFLYIKGSMKRLAKLNTKGMGYDVCKEYFRGLLGLVDVLQRRLPSKKGEDKTTIATPELELAQVHALGVLVNTAEYCSETLPQLQESLVKMVDEDDRDKVDLEDVQDRFDALINNVIGVVVTSVMSQVEKSLSEMSRLNLATMESVGDTSAYAHQIRDILKRNVTTFSAVISADYHHYFCNKLVMNFLPKFMLAISRCRRIGDLGTQQLLLDAEACKTVLLELPSYGSDTQEEVEKRKKKVPKSYPAMVLKQVARAEAVLKTISQPVELLNETFSALVPNGNFADLAKIMELKGLKKSEQQPILLAYNTKIPTEQQSAPILKDDAAVKKYFLFG